MNNQPLAKLIACQEIGRTNIGVFAWDNNGDIVTIVGIKPENDTFIPLSAHCGEGDARTTLWQRQGEHNRPELCDIDGEVMIAVMNRERSEILALVFLDDAMSGNRRHEAQRLTQKKKAAEFFGVEHFKLDREERACYDRERSQGDDLVSVPVRREPKQTRRTDAPANPVIPADVAAAVVTTPADPTEPIRRELLSRDVETVYKKTDGAPMTGIRVVKGDHLDVLPDGTECITIEHGHGHHFKVVGGKQRERIAVTVIPPTAAAEGADETTPKQLH